jgi:hypothetical protein
MSTLAVFVALGGGAYAATQLGKNSVGSKQLRKNAVVSAKVRNGAITAKKIKKGALNGAEVTGTVPSAQTANALAAPEAWHLVGAPGEPPFAKDGGVQAKNFGKSAETVGFYKDQEGIVHLKGRVLGPGEGVEFNLPPGFRPADEKALTFTTFCETCLNYTGLVVVYGVSKVTSGSISYTGAVVGDGENLSLDGIAFRAEG